MTLLTALTIQTRGDDVVCAGYLDKNTDKFRGAIDLHHDGFFHTHLLSQREAVHDTEAAAIAAMEGIVKQIRVADLGAELETSQKERGKV
jgi:hypothetical protein